VKVTGMPLTAWPLEVVAVAVAVMVEDPSFLTVGALSCSERFEAVAQVEVAPEAAEAALQFGSFSHGTLPAFPSPPQEATSETVIAAKAHFKNFIKVSLDFWLGLAGVSGRPCGR